MTKTLNAIRFISMIERLENAMYRFTMTEAATHDDAALDFAREECHTARTRVYGVLKTLSKEDIESL